MAVAVANKLSSGASAASSAVTPSVTPVANRLYLLTVATRTAITADPNTPTATGAGLTWVQVATTLYDTTSSTRKRITMFRAMGVGSAGALTIDFTGQTQTDIEYILDEFTGVDAGGTNGSSAIVQSNVNSDGTATIMAVTVTLAAFKGAGNATYGSSAIGQHSVYTPDTGYSTVTQDTATTNDAISQFNVGNDTSVVFTWADPTEIGAIAVEIKVARLARPIFVGQAVNRASTF